MSRNSAAGCAGAGPPILVMVLIILGATFINESKKTVVNTFVVDKYLCSGSRCLVAKNVDINGTYCFIRDEVPTPTSDTMQLYHTKTFNEWLSTPTQKFYQECWRDDPSNLLMGIIMLSIGLSAVGITLIVFCIIAICSCWSDHEISRNNPENNPRTAEEEGSFETISDADIAAYNVETKTKAETKTKTVITVNPPTNTPIKTDTPAEVTISSTDSEEANVDIST